MKWWSVEKYEVNGEDSTSVMYSTYQNYRIKFGAHNLSTEIYDTYSSNIRHEYEEDWRFVLGKLSFFSGIFGSYLWNVDEFNEDKLILSVSENDLHPAMIITLIPD